MKKFLVIILAIGLQYILAQEVVQPKDSCTLYIPNSASPGHDIKPWTIISTCPMELFSMEIYDRWGIKLHKQDSLGKDNVINWNYSKMPGGTYVYMIKYKFAGNEATEEKKITGHFNINR